MQAEIGYSYDVERKVLHDNQTLQEAERGYAMRARQYLALGDEYAEFAKMLKGGKLIQ